MMSDVTQWIASRMMMNEQMKELVVDYDRLAQTLVQAMPAFLALSRWCNPESRWRADTAEWLTLYLQAKGPVSTKRIKRAWRSCRRKMMYDRSLSYAHGRPWSTLPQTTFSDVRQLARDMQLVNGTIWALPCEHPLANQLQGNR